MKKYNILHLDDNPIFIDLIKVILENTYINYEFVHYDDEAYNFLKKKIPDLMIVDLIRNGDCCDYEPGINFIKKINSEFPNLKIMVVTGSPDETLQNKLEKYIIAYEHKNFVPLEFRKKVMNILETNS